MLRSYVVRVRVPCGLATYNGVKHDVVVCSCRGISYYVAYVYNFNETRICYNRAYRSVSFTIDSVVGYECQRFPDCGISRLYDDVMLPAACAIRLDKVSKNAWKNCAHNYHHSTSAPARIVCFSIETLKPIIHTQMTHTYK